jgi:hypothetical protein
LEVYFWIWNWVLNFGFWFFGVHGGFWDDQKFWKWFFGVFWVLFMKFWRFERFWVLFFEVLEMKFGRILKIWKVLEMENGETWRLWFWKISF